MKNLLIVMTALLAGATCLGAANDAAARLEANTARISLSDARGRIDKAIAGPAVMKAIMRHLSADDQRQFLADVNAAIATMPGSDAERTATFVAANRAALEGAQKGNVATLVAESFATVSPSALPALSESLGADLMNRATDRGHTYTDEQYLKLAQTVMEKVNARVAGGDHADVRSGFAALMFARGSNDPKPEIVAALVAMLPASAREAARDEWFPAALAEGDAKSYDAMLAAADVEAPEAVTPAGPEGGAANRRVNEELRDEFSLRVAKPQFAESLLADIMGANTDPTLAAEARNPTFDALTAAIEPQLPTLGTGAAADDVGAVIGEALRRDGRLSAPHFPEEPGGYQWQSPRH